MPMMISVLLVEDDALVRAGLRLLINTLSGVEVCGEAADGREALRLIPSLHPTLVLTDLCMPLLDGIGLTREVRRRHPEVRVLVLTAHPNEAYLRDALAAGAAGYLLKASGIAELGIAI